MNINNGNEVFPGIIIYENIIDNCKELIELSIKSDRWRESEIELGINTKPKTDSSIRNTKILDVPGIYSNDLKWFEVSQIVWKYANKYGIDFNISFSEMEPMQLLHYYAGSGFYKSHHDDGPGDPRIFSSILYLNDVNEGGETHFDKFNISVSPKAGRLVIFPANYTYSHEARVPISNDKFALVTWFRPLI
jgi:hypothetical protein